MPSSYSYLETDYYSETVKQVGSSKTKERKMPRMPQMWDACLFLLYNPTNYEEEIFKFSNNYYLLSHSSSNNLFFSFAFSGMISSFLTLKD